MARRERYEAALKCERCGTEGSATYEGNQNPVHNTGDLRRELLDIAGGFRAGKGRDPSIYCTHCGLRR
jgi:hypothetical protein